MLLQKNEVERVATTCRLRREYMCLSSSESCVFSSSACSLRSRISPSNSLLIVFKFRDEFENALMCCSEEFVDHAFLIQ
jgi:hypothetical protein